MKGEVILDFKKGGILEKGGMTPLTNYVKLVTSIFRCLYMTRTILDFLGFIISMKVDSISIYL